MVLSEDAGNREIVARANRSNDQPIAGDGTPTKVLLNNPVTDTSGALNLSNNRIVIPETGYYALEGAVYFALGNTNTRIRAAIYVNGIEVRLTLHSGNSNGTAGIQVIASAQKLNKGDFVELFAGQETGASVNVGGNLLIAKLASPQTIAYSENPAPSRNYVINGNFDYWQRGTSLASGTGIRFLADRFATNSSGSTYTTAQQAFAAGQSEVPNNPRFFHRNVVSSVAGVDNFVGVFQKIEDARTLSNKQVTVSFWAKADATKPISIEFIQDFGTGGSFSSPVFGIGVRKINITDRKSVV
jgi:hypothetical protein